VDCFSFFWGVESRKRVSTQGDGLHNGCPWPCGRPREERSRQQIIAVMHNSVAVKSANPQSAHGAKSPQLLHPPRCESQWRACGIERDGDGTRAENGLAPEWLWGFCKPIRGRGCPATSVNIYNLTNTTKGCKSGWQCLNIYINIYSFIYINIYSFIYIYIKKIIFLYKYIYIYI